MSAANLPDSAPALVHTPDRQASDPGQLLSGSSHTAAGLLLFPSTGLRITGLPALPDPPVYLRTCRLIC
jgi:hypothetical protein